MKGLFCTRDGVIMNGHNENAKSGKMRSAKCKNKAKKRARAEGLFYPFTLARFIFEKRSVKADLAVYEIDAPGAFDGGIRLALYCGGKHSHRKGAALGRLLYSDDLVK